MALASAVFATPLLSRAANFEFTDGNNTAIWEDAANWDLGTDYPGEVTTDNASINNAGPNTPFTVTIGVPLPDAGALDEVVIDAQSNVSTAFDFAADTLRLGTVTDVNQNTGGNFTTTDGTVTLSSLIAGEITGANNNASVFTADGATTIVSADNTVLGDAGFGSYFLQNGASHSGTTLTVARQSTGGGALTTSAATFNLTGDLVVGDAGTGSVTVTDTTASTGNVIIGAQAGSAGYAYTEGFNQWDVNGYMQVGAVGDGTLVVEGNADSVDIHGQLDVGATAGASGIVIQTFYGDGGNHIEVDEQSRIGYAATGSLSVDGNSTFVAHAGASPTSTALIAGTLAGVSGDIIADNNANIDATDGDTIIGLDGQGTLTVTNGASMATTNLIIAQNTGSSGDATVQNQYSKLTADNVYLDGSETIASTTSGASLSAVDSAVIQIKNRLQLWKGLSSVDVTGTPYSLPAGAIVLGQTGGNYATPADGAITIEDTGTLAGIGVVTGNVVNAGGIVAPGNSPGLLTVTGSVTLNDGYLDLEIGGTIAVTDYDVLKSAGLIIGSNGVIRISLINTFAPALNDAFNVADFTSFTGTPTFDYSAAPLAGGLAWSASTFPTDGKLRITAIPEPTSLAILALPTTLLTRRRRA